MKKNYALVLLGLGAVGVLAYKSLALSKASDLFTYTIEKLGFGKFTLKDFTIKFNVGLENPTNQSGYLDSFTGGVFYNDNQIATVETPPGHKLKLLPKTKSVISLSSIIPYSSSIDFIFLAAQKKLKYPIVVKGIVSLGGVELPVEKSFSLTN